MPDGTVADHALDGEVAGVPGFVVTFILEVLLDQVARPVTGGDDLGELLGGSHEPDVPASAALGRLHDGGIVDAVGDRHRLGGVETGRCRPERGARDTGRVEHGTLDLFVDERMRHVGRVVRQPYAFGQEGGVDDVVVDEGHDAPDTQARELLGDGVESLVSGVDDGPEPSDEAEHRLGDVPGVHDPYEFGAVTDAVAQLQWEERTRVVHDRYTPWHRLTSHRIHRPRERWHPGRRRCARQKSPIVPCPPRLPIGRSLGRAAFGVLTRSRTESTGRQWPFSHSLTGNGVDPL